MGNIHLTLAGTVFRNVTRDEVTFSLDIEPEHVPVRGNASASGGDDDEDHDCENEIIRRLDQGDQWAWCCVVVTARWENFEGSDCLGCCSYDGAADFKAGGYYEQMCDEAFARLQEAISRAAETLAPCFPESPDREHLERVLFALACAMGYSGAEGIVSDYLDGRSVLTRIGSRGVWHFDHMTRTCGMKPPEGA